MFNIGDKVKFKPADYAPPQNQSQTNEYTVDYHNLSIESVYNVEEAGGVLGGDVITIKGKKFYADRFVLVEPTPEQKATQDFDDAMKAAWADPRSHTVKILPPSFDYRQAYEKSMETVDKLLNILESLTSCDIGGEEEKYCGNCDASDDEPCKSCNNKYELKWQPHDEHDCDTCEYEHLPYDDCKKCITDWLDNGEKGSTGWKEKDEDSDHNDDYDGESDDGDYDDVDDVELEPKGIPILMCDDCFFSNFPAVMTAVNSPCLTCKPGVRPHWWAKVANSPGATPPTSQEPSRGCHNCKNIKKHTVPLMYEPCLSCVKDWHASNGDNGLTQWEEKTCVNCIHTTNDYSDSPCNTCDKRSCWEPKEPVKAKVESRPIKKCYLCKDKALAVRLEPCLTCDKDSTDGYGHTRFTPKEDQKEPEVSEARKQYDYMVADRRCGVCTDIDTPSYSPPCKGCAGITPKPNFSAKPFTE